MIFPEISPFIHAAHDVQASVGGRVAMCFAKSTQMSMHNTLARHSSKNSKKLFYQEGIRSGSCGKSVCGCMAITCMPDAAVLWYKYVAMTEPHRPAYSLQQVL